MKTLEFDFSDMPKAMQEQPKTMFFDFSDFPEEQKPASPKEMLFDFSPFPEDQKSASLKEMPFDFSAFPEQPKPEAFPYAGEDHGSQLGSYNPDSWINDKIPAAPAQPLFASVPRPPERLYRENAPQILQDIWNAASPEPAVGPLREHPLRPDVRQPLWTLFKEQALPNEPTEIVENMEAGLRQASAHVAANVISLIGSPMDENGGPTREEQYNSVYKAIYKTILPDNLAPPQDFTDSLARGVGEAAPSLVEAMLLSYATGGALNPLFEGMAAKFPTLAARLFPVARDALTFGAQGALEPGQPARQVAIGTGVGAILGTLSPYSPLARVICGFGIGAGQEYFTNSNATAQDYARSATLTGIFSGLAGVHGLTPEETIAGTLFDWAETKGYTPEEISRLLQMHGIRPVLNEFADDMTAPQMENRSGVTAGVRPGESRAVRKRTETSVSMDKLGPQEVEQGPPKEDLDFSENSEDVPKSGATFGQATTNDYRSTFFAAHPELEEFKSEIIVHHAVEKRVLTKFPGVATEEEIHSLENLRGIPKDANSDVHLRQIRLEWNRFYRPFTKTDTAPTKAQLLQKATEIDSMFGSKFMPPVGGK